MGLVSTGLFGGRAGDRDRVHLKVNEWDAGFGIARKARNRRNSNAISRVSNTASGFEDKSQPLSLG